MASSQTRTVKVLSEEDKETACADDLWAYIEAHKDEVEDLEEYARKRGLKTTAQNAL
jgi:hypothetical protein